MESRFSPYYIGSRTRRELFDQMTRLRKRVDELDPEGVGGGFNADIRRIENEVAEIQQRLDDIGDGGGDVDLTDIHNEISTIQRELRVVERDKVDSATFNLELSLIKDDITVLKENLGGSGGTDPDLQLKIDELESLVHSIQLEVDTITGDWDGLVDSVDTLTQRVDNLSGSGGGGGIVIENAPEFTSLVPGDFYPTNVNRGGLFYQDIYGDGTYVPNVINDFWSITGGEFSEYDGVYCGLLISLNNELSKLEINPNTSLLEGGNIEYKDPNIQFNIAGELQGFSRADLTDNHVITVEITWEFSNTETFTIDLADFDSLEYGSKSFILEHSLPEGYNPSINKISIDFPYIDDPNKKILIDWISLNEGENQEGHYTASKIGFGPFFKSFL